MTVQILTVSRYVKARDFMGVSASSIKSAITMVITIAPTIVNANVFSFIFLPFSIAEARLALTGSPVFHESKHGYMCKRLESDQTKVNSLSYQTTTTRYPHYRRDTRLSRSLQTRVLYSEDPNKNRTHQRNRL